MGLSSNIMRRSGSSRYYLRIYVPKEHQGQFGKKDIWKSLGTSDPKKAKLLARPLQIEWDQTFEKAAIKQAKRALDEYELQHAVWECYSSLLKADEARRQATPTNDDLNAIWNAVVEQFGGEYDIATWRILEEMEGEPEVNAKERGERLAALIAEVKTGNIRTIRPTLTEIVASRNLAIPAHSADERKLARSIQRAEIDALKVIAKRDQGDYSGIPSDPLVKPPSATASLVAAPGESVLELFDIYAAENPNGARSGTLRQSRKVIDLFSQFMGRHFPTRKISKKEVREWKAALKGFPVKGTETKAFHGMDFRQIIAANATLGKPPISPKTLNRYLASVGAYCKWLVAQGYLEHSPTPGMLLKIDKSLKKVHPYSSEQLTKVFQSPLFTGCDSIKSAHKPGNMLVKSHFYWLPLMSLFTGGRITELSQLLTSDVKKVKSHWAFHITDESDTEQKLKTADSKRFVPIHPMLVDLGFLDFHQARILAGDRWLFPSILLDSRGSRSGRYSDFYNSYITRIGVKIDRTLNFHSFRHTFADALRNAGFLNAEFGFLLGHAQLGVTGQYGAIKEGDIERRVMLVNSVAYDGLDLSPLFPINRSSKPVVSA